MNYYLHCPGAQVTRSERVLIKDIAERYKGTPRATFVNIGVMWGCTVHCLRAGHATANITAVDIKDAWHIKFKDDLDVHWVIADSRTYKWNGPIHVLLVDGDHHYETITADISNWTPHVPPNGTVIFHDYAPTPLNLRQFPELADVKRAVGEWQQVETDSGREWKVVGTADSIIAYRRVS